MAENRPIISIICCTYNRQGFARTHFEAMRSHLGEDIELIYALDNCTDETRAVLEALADGHPKVRVLEHIGQQGLFNCRNFGVAQARGNYIHFLDDDDSVAPGFYASIIACLSEPEHRQIDLCLSRLKVISDKDGEYIRDVFSPALQRQLTTKGALATISSDLFDHFLQGDIYFNGSNAIFSSELLRRYPYNNALKKSADWLLILEASLKQTLSVGYCATATANYVVHADSMSTKPDKVLWNLQVFELLLEMAKARPDQFRAVEKVCALANFHAGYAVRKTDPQQARRYYWRSFNLHAQLKPLLALVKSLAGV